jgi:hypothetical protein
VRPIGIFALALALAACTSMQWAKPDAAPEQVSRDGLECDQRARREASAAEWLHPPVPPVYARDEKGRGPFIWPTGSAVDPYAGEVADQNRIVRLCMESKGYTLAPARQ